MIQDVFQILSGILYQDRALEGGIQAVDADVRRPGGMLIIFCISISDPVVIISCSHGFILCGFAGYADAIVDKIPGHTLYTILLCQGAFL